MKHLHANEAKDNEQEIKQFAQEVIDLWLEKHRNFERFDLLQVLVELILNPDAKYYQMDDKDRDTWLLCAVTLLASEMKEKSKVFIPPTAQMEAMYRILVGFDDDLCDDCKKQLRDNIENDIALRVAKDILKQNGVRLKQDIKEKHRRWWQRNKKVKDDKMTPLECAEMNGDL